MRMRFGLKSLLFVVFAIAVALACWQSTRTQGIPDVRANCDREFRDRFRYMINTGAPGQDAELVEKTVMQTDCSQCFENPIVTFPFIVSYDEKPIPFAYPNEAPSEFYTYQYRRRTRIWFFGYVSAPY
jgi:hypothetical protein